MLSEQQIQRYHETYHYVFKLTVEYRIVNINFEMLTNLKYTAR